MMLSNRASISDKKNSYLNIYLKPNNCLNVVVPRVNKGIWSTLDHSDCDADLKLQASQQLVVKCFYPLLHLMDTLYKANMQ